MRVIDLNIKNTHTRVKGHQISGPCKAPTHKSWKMSAFTRDTSNVDPGFIKLQFTRSRGVVPKLVSSNQAAR